MASTRRALAWAQRDRPLCRGSTVRRRRCLYHRPYVWLGPPIWGRMVEEVGAVYCVLYCPHLEPCVQSFCSSALRNVEGSQQRRRWGRGCGERRAANHDGEASGNRCGCRHRFEARPRDGEATASHGSNRQSQPAEWPARVRLRRQQDPSAAVDVLDEEPVSGWTRG